MECGFLHGMTTMITQPEAVPSPTMEDGGSGTAIRQTLTVCMECDRREDYLGWCPRESGYIPHM